MRNDIFFFQHLLLIVCILWQKNKKVDIISRAPNGDISHVLYMLDDILEETCLKHKQQMGILLDIWKKKNHIITGRVKFSLP